MAISDQDKPLESVPAASTLLYTAPTVLSARIMYAMVRNYSASAATLTVNIPQNGDSVANSNEYWEGVIQPGKQMSLYELVGRVLNTGDTIYLQSSVASALNVNFGIKEITS